MNYIDRCNTRSLSEREREREREREKRKGIWNEKDRKEFRMKIKRRLEITGEKFKKK